MVGCDTEFTARPGAECFDCPLPRSLSGLAGRTKGELAIGVYGPWAMTGRYFDRLRELTNRFDEAFKYKSGWAFLDDFNVGELQWLHQVQAELHGSKSARAAFLKRQLAKRGLSLAAKTTTG
jgi:hypothetical protein